MTTCHRSRFLFFGFLCLAAASAVFAAPTGARWQRLPAPAGIARAEALAYAPASGRLAVGGERGVALGPIAGPLERVLSRGPVRALAFTSSGALLAATDAGLYRIEGPGRVTSERIAAGEAARNVYDLDSAAGHAAAATAAGVHVSFEERAPARWHRVAALPSGEARRVVLLPAADGSVSVWAVIEGELWRTTSEGRAERVSLPAAVEGEQGILDLARSEDGGLLAVTSGSLLLREASGVWRSEPLMLPPGATPRRVSAGPDAFWLATDAGLLWAVTPSGPWRRAGPPAGHIAVSAVAGSRAELVVATAHGLLRHIADGAPVIGRTGSAPVDAQRFDASGDPPVLRVQQVALRYLELQPEHMRALRDAARRSGRYPELALRGSWGSDRHRGDDYDQAFLSGQKRHLYDRDRDRGEDYGATIELSWDLGAAAYNPEQVDISREARLVAQLRDDVLDEINQLYFERQRVLASFDAPPPDVSVALLRVRAAELASGLDAWTGGWFSEQLSRGPDSPALERTP